MPATHYGPAEEFKARPTVNGVGVALQGEGGGSPLTSRVDDVPGVGMYAGEAAPGSAENLSVWRIKKITENGDDITAVWASGTAAFDKVWDSRASYVYS